MHTVWEHESPSEKFIRQLRRQRAIMFMKNKEYLRSIRCNHEIAKADQKAFGAIWKEYGTDIYQLIAGACGESWDSEDEQKNAPAPLKKETALNQKDDDLVRTREKGALRGEHQFQRKFEARECVLEEEQGRRNQKSPQKAPRPQKGKEGRC